MPQRSTSSSRSSQVGANSKRVSVWSTTAGKWVDGHVAGDVSGHDPEQPLIVEYEIPGLGQCRKSLLPNSEDLSVGEARPHRQEIDPCSAAAPHYMLHELLDRFEIDRQDVKKSDLKVLDRVSRELCDIFLDEKVTAPVVGQHMEMVLWAFMQCAKAMDPIRRDNFDHVLPWLLAGLLKRGTGEVRRWSLMLEDRIPESLEQLMGECPLNGCSPAVFVGLVAVDAHQLWLSLDTRHRHLFMSELVQSEHKTEFHSAISARGLLSGDDRFAYIAARQSIQFGDITSAFELLRLIPQKGVCKLPGSNGDCSYYDLFPLLQLRDQRKGQHEAEELIDLLLDADIYCDAAMQAFINNQENSLRDVYEFLISYTSALRMRDVDTRKRVSAPLLFLERIFSTTGADIDEHQNALEAALLLFSGDDEMKLHRWVKEKFDIFGHVQDMLRHWGKHRLRCMLEPLLEGDMARKELHKAAKSMLKNKHQWVYKDRDGKYFAQKRRASFRPCQREPSDVAQLVWMYFKLIATVDGGLALIQDFVNCLGCTHDGPGSFGRLELMFPRGSMLRNTLVEDVHRALGSNPPPIALVDELIGYRGFFEFSFCELLQDVAALRRIETCFPTKSWQLIEALVKLISVDESSCCDLVQGVKEIRESCADTISKTLFWKVVDATVDLRAEDFRGFQFEQFQACARRLSDSTQCLKAGVSTSLWRNIGQVVDELLKAAPIAWLPLFSSLDTIIFFLKYEDLEDLSLAFKKFEAEITNDALGQESRSAMLQLLQCVKELYTGPLVKCLGCKHEEDGGTKEVIAKAPHQMTSPVMWGNVSFSPTDWALVLEIALAQVQSMQDKYNVLMQPHHTQVISFLMFAYLVCSGKPGQPAPILGQTMLAQVGTGEGKSWIIGMLAAFIAKKGMRAHVVIDNEALLERDRAMMAGFYAKLDIIVGTGQEKELADKTCQVVYCLAAEVEYACLKCVEGEEGYVGDTDDAILIVDEVDGLIIAEDPNLTFQYPDEGVDEHLTRWLGDGLEGLGNIAEPEEQYFRTVLDEVRRAHKLMKKKKQGYDYMVSDDTAYYINKRTNLTERNTVPLWLDLKRFELNSSHKVRYFITQAIICRHRCFTAYSRIFGLSASVGRKAERNYLKDLYGASFFNVPLFLDTCRGTDGRPLQKSQPVLKDADRIVQPNKAAQVQAVVELAVEKCTDVPVLVLAENVSMVEEIAKAVRAALPEQYRSKNDEGVLEILAYPGQATDFVRKVDLVTRPLGEEQSYGVRKNWRVAITTPEGGRGHDFRVMDPEVDEKGGLLVILTWVPRSERDWTQFLGRTARQDRKGQYAVFLDAEDGRTPKHPCSGDRIIKEMLKLGDNGIEHDLKKAGTESERGALMHRLSAAFWREKCSKLGLCHAGAQHSWISICQTFMGKDLDEIESEFRQKVLGQSEHVRVKTMIKRETSSLRNSGMA